MANVPHAGEVVPPVAPVSQPRTRHFIPRQTPTVATPAATGNQAAEFSDVDTAVNTSQSVPSGLTVSATGTGTVSAANASTTVSSASETTSASEETISEPSAVLLRQLQAMWPTKNWETR